MRATKPILAGLLGLTALAACGLPPAPSGAPERGDPGATARRYQVLTTMPLCTPTPGNCTALAGETPGFWFLLVDQTPRDVGQVSFFGNLVNYFGNNVAGDLSTNTAGERILTMTAQLEGVWAGPLLPGEDPPEVDPVTLQIVVNLTTFAYEVEGEGSENDRTGTLNRVIVREETCTPITVPELFPG